jgi:hypothetical protein
MEDDDICRSIVILLEFNRKICFSIFVCVVYFSAQDPFFLFAPVVNSHPDFGFCYRLPVHGSRFIFRVPLVLDLVFVPTIGFSLR